MTTNASRAVVEVAADRDPTSPETANTMPRLQYRPSITDRLLDWRDRLLQKPPVLRFLSRFPPTRSFAAAREQALFDLTSGFVYTQVLTACVTLDVFKILKEGSLPIADLSRRIGLSAEATERLANAAVSIGLLSRRSGARIALGELGLAVATFPALEAVVRHNTMLYADLADPVSLLQGGRAPAQLEQFWAYANRPAPEQLDANTVGAYSAFMGATQEMIAEDILDAYPMHGHTNLLDVGGGEGVFLTAVARRAPEPSLTLFDLPAVADRARRRFEAAGIAERTRVVGGSFLKDALPMGADVVSLVRVLFDHDDDTALRILSAARAALPKGGRLVVAETLSGSRVGDAYFGFYLLAMGQGRTRSLDEISGLLRAAGFTRVAQKPGPRRSIVSVIVARAA